MSKQINYFFKNIYLFPKTLTAVVKTKIHVLSFYLQFILSLL